MSSGRPRGGGSHGSSGGGFGFGGGYHPGGIPPRPPRRNRDNRDFLFGMLFGSQLGRGRRQGYGNRNTGRMEQPGENRANYAGTGPAGYREQRNPYNSKVRFWTVVAVILLLITVIMGFLYFRNSNQNTREKLQVLNSYDSACIADNEYWFDNVSSTEGRLKDFFNKTGVQPYIVINSFDPDLTSDTEKTAYAEQWYDANIDNECSFLYMYFPESDPDEVGYMSYVVGKQAETVMDTDVVDTFWDNLDTNWYSDKSTDEMFYDTFISTARYAMKDYSPVPTVIVFALTAFSFVLVIRNTRNARSWEKAKETEKILNADIDQMAEKYAEKK